jgi:hypothetical protein
MPAERVANVLRRDAGASAGFGAMSLDESSQCAAPFLAPCPGDQSRDVMRRGQGAASCREWPLCFPGRRVFAIPGVESAVLRSQTRPVAGRNAQLHGVSWRRVGTIPVA